MVALLSRVNDPHSNTTVPSPPPAPTSSGSTLSSPSSRLVLSRKRPFTSTPIHLRKIVLQKNCTGEFSCSFSISSISISYPTRPSFPILADISLYIPAHELPFIVGSSGSGKSTIAQLLLEMYRPQGGTVLLDDTELRYLDPSFVLGNVCRVRQGMVDMVSEGKSILERCVGAGGCDRGGGRRRVHGDFVP